MADDCTLTPGCQRGRHAPEAYPCGGPFHTPGDPCQFCGKPTPLSGGPCPDCWISLEGLPLADIKGLLALGNLSVDVPKWR